jgi:hypothetical protein
MADSGYKSISRIDIPKKRMYGWQVRVWFKGQMHTKFFNERHFAGPEEALQVAVDYRNELERSLGKPRTDRVVVAHSPRNQTGVIGVRRTRRQTGGYSAGGEPNYSEVYEVTWQPEPNVIRRRTFSIVKYGEAEAFRRACEVRQAQEQQIYREE